MMTFAPRSLATRALDKSNTDPTPACPCFSVAREIHRRSRSKAVESPSFSGQVLARARIQFAVFDALNAKDGGHAEDVMGVGAARDIRRRAVEAEKNLAVRIGAGDV